MKNIKLILSVLAMLVLWSACQKTIMPKLNNSTPKLVIQGAVSDTAGPYQVSISKTVDFYNSNVYPPVSGASVTIRDTTTGITDLLTETSPGTYTTHIITGTPGNTYSLTVMMDGKTYTAMSTMPKPVLLDSVTFDYSHKNQSSPEANFQDPADQVNFYKLSMKKNGVSVARIQAEQDLLTNGRYIRHLSLDVDTGTFEKGDIAQVSLIGIDHAVYTFISEAANIAYNNDRLAAPATPQSNITGGCDGYFSAQTVSSKSAVVQKVNN